MREYKFNPDSTLPIVGTLITGPKGTKKIRLVFDTGAVMTQLHDKTMASIGLPESTKIARADVIGVGGKEQEGYAVRVIRFFVMGARLEAPTIAAYDMSYLAGEGIDGLLGYDLIKHFHLEVNGPQGILRVF